MSEFKHTLPAGTVLHGNECDYTIIRPLMQDGFGISYLASGMPHTEHHKSLLSFHKDKDHKYVVREHFMYYCSHRADDDKAVIANESSESVVDEFKEVFDYAIPWFREISLRYTSIIDIIELFESNNTSYYVTEYLDGPTLFEYIREYGIFSPDESREALTPIFLAVRYLHTQHIIHTDLSPHSIIMQPLPGGGFRPVLTHLFYCKPFIDRSEMAWRLPPLACPEFYSPIEQYKEMDTFLPQSNVYSLAAILLYTLTGKELPTARKVDADVVRSIAASASLPEEFVDTIVKALSPDWHDRQENISTLRIELINTLSESERRIKAEEEKEAALRKRKKGLGIISISLGIMAICMAVIAALIYYDVVR